MCKADTSKQMARDLQKVEQGIWDCRCLADVLQEIIQSGDNLKPHHISTLSRILCEHIHKTKEYFQNFQIKYNLF